MIYLYFIFMLGHCSNCCTSPEEELDLYRKYWQRHYDIVLRQEADLFEQVTFYGYSPQDLECYKNSEANLGLTDKNYESIVVENRAPANRSTVKYEEEVVEEGNEEELERYTSLASSDATVLKYATKPDVEPDRYPPSFERVVPAGVLKALYYGRYGNKYC